MGSVFSTVHYEVDWGLTHVGRQLDMKGMPWVLQQIIPTEAGHCPIDSVHNLYLYISQKRIFVYIYIDILSSGQGTLKEGNPSFNLLIFL